MNLLLPLHNPFMNQMRTRLQEKNAVPVKTIYALSVLWQNRKRLAEQEVELANKTAALAEQEAELANKTAALAEQKAALSDKDKIIEKLKKQLAEIQSAN